MSKKNIVAAAAFLIFGILILSESFKIRLLKFGSALGGDFFPKLLSITLIVLSSIWLILNLYQFLKKEKNNDEKPENRSVLVRPMLFITVFVVYIITLRWLGFTIPTVFLAFVNYLLLKDRLRYTDLLAGVGYSLLATFLIWFLFTKILGLQLPMGVL
ncbi:MAG: tripartite tricarboxylate transporter TctB family protein [Pseudothermotoga sp.]